MYSQILRVVLSTVTQCNCWEKKENTSLCMARFIFCSLIQSFSLWCPTSTRVSSTENAAWAGPRCSVLCLTPHAAIQRETLASPRVRRPQDKSQNWGGFISQSSSFHVVSGPCRFPNFVSVQQFLLKNFTLEF